MKTFTVENGLADRLEREIIHEGRPKYSYLPKTAKYNYNNRSSTAGGIKIVSSHGFTNNVYTMHRDLPAKGLFEEMLKKESTNAAVVAPSIAEIVFYLRKEFLDPSYDVVRVYVNIMTKGVEYGVLDPHPDFKDPDLITFLYYVTDSDGDTFIFNEETDTVLSRHTPKKGTGIVYPSSTIHAASVPMKYEIRSALNIIYGKDHYKQHKRNILDMHELRRLNNGMFISNRE